VLQNHYRDDVKNISDAELQSYYNDNVAQFEEIQLERLYVPKAVNGQRQDEAAVKAKAEALRARAAAGEAFDALQKEAWGTNQQAPPPTKVGPLRRGAMPTPLENQIFALKVGEISPVLDEQPGYYIIRMIGRRTLPFADVKDQIHDQLEKKKFADLMRGVLELKPALNPSYFTTPAPGSQP